MVEVLRHSGQIFFLIDYQGGTLRVGLLAGAMLPKGCITHSPVAGSLAAVRI